MNHVNHTDPVLETFSNLVIRDKKVTFSNGFTNGIDVHDSAEWRKAMKGANLR